MTTQSDKEIIDSSIYQILAITLIGIIVLVYLVSYRKCTWIFAKINKGKLVEYYRVDARTFKKWIRYFTPNLCDKLQTKQKLYLLEVFVILLLLGIPDEDNPVLSKGMIVQKGEGSYRSLRESIALNNHLWPIESEAFRKLSVFPPLVCQQLLEIYS